MVNPVELKNVSVRYQQRLVLDDIHFTVHPKEIVTIVGPNGSGKTTMLKAILGLVKSFQGNIRVLGRPPGARELSGEIGYLPQENHPDIHFPASAYDIVAMSMYANKSPMTRLSKNDRKIIEGSLERVEMDAFSGHHFGSMSGGQKQRVLIARALALNPKLLLLDEPATGLDAVAQDQFYHLLQDLRDREGLAILMVSHDIGAVSEIVDQIACLNRRIHFHGSPRDCIPRDALNQVFGKNIQFVYHDKHCKTCEKHS